MGQIRLFVSDDNHKILIISEKSQNSIVDKIHTLTRVEKHDIHIILKPKTLNIVHLLKDEFKDNIEEYSGLSLAQAISRYHRRRSYDFLTLSRGNGEHGYIRSWRNSRNRRNTVLYERENNVPFFKNYDEIVGR